jgi:hypothetical protein
VAVERDPVNTFAKATETGRSAKRKKKTKMACWLWFVEAHLAGHHPSIHQGNSGVHDQKFVWCQLEKGRSVTRPTPVSVMDTATPFGHAAARIGDGTSAVRRR